MRYRISFLSLIVVIGLISVGFTQISLGASAPSVTLATSSTYPYDAEITGDSVYVRTGPGTAFYEWGKLYKGDKVRVMGDLDGVWSKIQPLPDSFSWISAQYVDVDRSDPTIGTIKGDNVRVWAGSPLYSPERSTTPQGKLNKGDKVKIIGQPVNNYYKISVPSLPDAYYWVSTQYTKPIPREVAPSGPIATPLNNSGVTIKPYIPETSTTSVVGPNLPAMAANVVDVNSAAIAESEIKVTPLDKYYVLQKQVEEERAKPINEQDYSSIKKMLQEIVDDKDAGKAAIFAQAVLDRISGIELALNVDDIVKQQNEQFNQSKENIEKAYAKKMGEVQDLGKYAVIGKLEKFLMLGSGNYRVVDTSDPDKTICYAVPNEKIAGRDLSGFIGKKVGLVGTIEPYTQTLSAMVRFTDVVNLEGK